MSFNNFKILAEKLPQLAEIATFSENYVYTDPQSSIAKSRLFIEKLTKILYKAYKIEIDSSQSLVDWLSNPDFKAVVPNVILYIIHSIRKSANIVVHGGTVSSNNALSVLLELYEISKWCAAVLLGIKPSDYPDFVSPKPQKELEDKTVSLLESTKLQETLNELEKLKIKLAEIQTVQKSNGIAVDELKYSEEQTRKRLIDSMIRDAGWNINSDGTSSDDVGQEIEVDGQPTVTGKGFVDYVLWGKDGNALAVIEAKKTSIDPEKGKKQASLYADALEKKYNKRPIIFYTNGFDTKLWDDKNNYPPRTVWGIYSRESLERLIFQRSKKDIAAAQPDAFIAGRDYQIRAIKAVCETFSKKNRKALIVQATGTGKTRVAIALTKLLQDNGWAKRILFLCDRNALVKQAKRNFNTLLNSEASAVVKANCENTRSSNIIFSTYPAMMNSYAKYDIGYFDLIIADESHRSIYNVYSDIFKYFDCLQVGLTATPVEFVNRNTFNLFNCDDGKPTSYYSLDDAIKEGHLVDYTAYRYDTEFLRKGIHYNQLSSEQQKQLEEDGVIEKELSVEARSIDKLVMNKPTSKLIIRNLMENGIKDADGQNVGKTIIFARNHNHAQFLLNIIDEMYPQYGGKLAAVIDIYDGRAESLIDEFSDIKSPMRIAISVDMLDTGIDVPEVVNLVFAKPVKSKVKFWQMIGRGTRLCENLFGFEQHKTFFKIFDHWQNFDYFAQENNNKNKAPEQKSLMQTIFENRLDICKKAQLSQNLEVYEDCLAHIVTLINQLPENSISVKEKWREKKYFAQKNNIDFNKADTEIRLKMDLARLMQWINIEGYSANYRFDSLVIKIEKNLIDKRPLEDLKQDLLNIISSLPININQVKNKIEIIDWAKSLAFWDNLSYADLEKVRNELRGIIYLAQNESDNVLKPLILNINEDNSRIIYDKVKNLYPKGMENYKVQITMVLQKIIDTEPVIQKIKEGQGLSKKEFEQILSLIMVQNPSLDKDVLKEFFPSTEKLEQILVSISGMDEAYIKAKFGSFIKKYHLTAIQNQFLTMLQNQIIQNNGINLACLYDAPFTLLNKDSIDGVFDDSQADELINILKNFSIDNQIKVEL